MNRTYDRPSAERLRPLLRSIVTEIEEREERLRQLERELRFTRRADEAFRASVVARIAENKKALRLAHQELSELGCELDPSAPRIVHVPGPDGRFSSGFELQLVSTDPSLETSSA